MRELKIYCFHVEATEKEHILMGKRMKAVLSELQKENAKNLIDVSLVVKGFITPQPFTSDGPRPLLKAGIE